MKVVAFVVWTVWGLQKRIFYLEEKENFDIKAAKASSDSERWRVSSERKRFLQVHSTIVARRNAAIFDYNAWPKMGGGMPRAPREQYE